MTKEEVLREIEELARFHSVEVPMIYGDGTETTDKMVSLEELGRILAEIEISIGEKEHKNGTSHGYSIGECEDAIDRAKAQTEIMFSASRYSLAKERGGMGQVEWSDELIKVSEVIDILRALPSVTVRQTGHWVSDVIQGEIDGQIVKAFTCSECGAISVFRMSGGKIVNGDSCPSCRARMRGAKNV